MKQQARSRDHGSLSKYSDPIERLEQIICKETLKIRFWYAVKEFAERHWLKSHGWIETRYGWLVPDWHPKLRRHLEGRYGARSYVHTTTFLGQDVRAAIPEIGEPYDLSHAENSHRYYTKHQTVAQLSNSQQKAPPFPPYVMWRPFQLGFWGAGNVFGVAALFLIGHWTAVACLILATLCVVASFIIAAWCRREWHLDWAETQLSRGKKSDVSVYYPN